MRSRLLFLGLTVLVCSAGFAQSQPASDVNSQQGSGSQSKTAREHGSGMATGKQAAQETNHLEQKNKIVHRDLAARKPSTNTQVSGDSNENTEPEAGSGMATGRREAGSGVATGKRQHATAQVNNEDSGEAKSKPGMSGAQSNPMYQDERGSGTNPFYEDKNARVQSGLQSTGNAVANGAAVVKTKTKSNQSNDRVQNPKDVRTEPAQPKPPQAGEPQ